MEKQQASSSDFCFSVRLIKVAGPLDILISLLREFVVGTAKICQQVISSLFFSKSIRKSNVKRREGQILCGD